MFYFTLFCEGGCPSLRLCDLLTFVYQDDALSQAVSQHGAKNWKKIAESVPGRTDVQCLHRWQKVLNPDLVKGPWTDEVGWLLPDFSTRLNLLMFSFVCLSRPPSQPPF